MGFKLYIANDLNVLKDQLLKDTEKNKAIFASDLIVTQTAGMKEWLSLKAADKNEIFTNFSFVRPDHIISKISKMAGLYHHRDMTAEKMKWLIYLVLDKEEFKNKFPEVARYYTNSDIKRLQLSEKMADLFDQYVIYRDEYINFWNESENQNENDIWKEKEKGKGKEKGNESGLKSESENHNESDFRKENLENSLLKVNIDLIKNYIEKFDPVEQKKRIDGLTERYNADHSSILYNEQWQRYLWKKIKACFNEEDKDRVQVKNELIEKLVPWNEKEYVNKTKKTKEDFNVFKKEQDELIKRINQYCPTVHFFGISVITKFHIEFIYNLSQHIDIHFYITNPAPEVYWYSGNSEENIQKWKAKLPHKKEIFNFLERGNSLLGNWGKTTRNFYRLIYKTDDDFINNTYSLIGKEIKTDSLLHLIQYEIHENLLNEERQEIDASFLNDNSIVISSCHSPIREVQELYNYLIDINENYYEGKLKGSDILVQVSDINTYRPYIKAVFDNAPYKFSYTLSDQSLKESDDLTIALIQLLELRYEEFSAERVCELLNYKIVRDRFHINDVQQIKTIVKELNILYGWTGDKAIETDLVSWAYGLEKIIYSIAFSGEEEINTMNGYTLQASELLEGNAIHNVLHFVHLVKKVFEFYNEAEQEKNIEDWKDWLNRYAEDFYPDGAENSSILTLLEQIEYLSEINNTELKTIKISKKVFLENIKNLLGETVSEKGFYRGDITFANLVPMRSIPFKVIALLGLNANDFPRKQNPLSFDLIQELPIPGDRNIKDSDKGLFLESMLCAENQLYLSYIGQHIETNKELQASPVIDELIQYIRIKTPKIEKIRETLIRKHPLHFFSYRYNQDTAALRSYLIPAQNTKFELSYKKEKDRKTELKTYSLDNLAKAYCRPYELFIHSVSNLKYFNDDIQLNSSEITELSDHEIKSLMNSIRENPETILSNKDTYLRQLKSTNALPLVHAGEYYLNEVIQRITDQETLFAKELEGYTKKVLNESFEIKLNDQVIKIKFNHFPVFISNKNILLIYQHEKNLVVNGTTLDHNQVYSILKIVLANAILTKAGYTVHMKFSRVQNNVITKEYKTTDFEPDWNTLFTMYDMALEKPYFFNDKSLDYRKYLTEDSFLDIRSLYTNEYDSDTDYLKFVHYLNYGLWSKMIQIDSKTEMPPEWKELFNALSKAITE